MNLRTSDFEYPLPEDLIAYYPRDRREDSRLMVLDRKTRRIQHAHFADICDFLSPGDLLVANDTKVMKARLRGKKARTGGKVEILLLKPFEGNVWEALVSPSRRIHGGTPIVIADGIECRVVERLEGSRRLIDFGEHDVVKIMDDFGEVPLPPYIRRQPAEIDYERYQTVFARAGGSVAAPTAGLHFSQGLLQKLIGKGIGIAYLTLHVGPGTFVPVREADPRRHKLDPEYFEIPEACCRLIVETKKRGHRVVAVGTTSVRALETAADEADEGIIKPRSGWTGKYILPPYDFKIVDALVTNFHLPRSTLLMLVCAFAGRDFVMKAYEQAVAMRYRFYSYGDAMLIL